jgi:hypothetical protein
VPLSDAARRLLLRQPEPPAASPAPAPVLPAADGHAKGRTETFADRARREAERYRLATDSEYWLCLCFRQPGDPAAFAAALGLTPDRRRVKGPDLEAATAKVQADQSHAARRRRMLAARATRGTDITAQLTARPLDDPLAPVPVTSDIQADSEAELAALLAALTASPDPAPVHVLDSPHWLAAYWPSRAAKDAWLTSTGLDALGDKYLDGNSAASILRVEL